MDSLSAAQFVAYKIALAAVIIAALVSTRVHEFYPDADLTIRIRKGAILPEIDIQDRVRNA